jgi:hypothetical protein
LQNAKAFCDIYPLNNVETQHAASLHLSFQYIAEPFILWQMALQIIILFNHISRLPGRSLDVGWTKTRSKEGAFFYVFEEF